MALRVGDTFDSIHKLRKACRQAAMAANVEHYVVKSDSTRFTVKCLSDHCSWRMHASCIPGSTSFQIKTMQEEHTCGSVSNLGNKEASALWVAKTYLQKFLEQPDYKPKDLIGDVRRDHGVKISYKKAWNAKEIAMEELHGNAEAVYAQMPTYCLQILETNPGSVAFVQRTIDGHFLRMFISYGASIAGFSHCRPLIGLDATHLKGKYFRILMAATGIDAKGQLLPIAFGVVNAENDDNWVWFMQCLKDCVHHSEQLTFVSDRQKGLVDGVSLVFGVGTPHAYCLRHLAENFRKAFKSIPLVQLLWTAARAHTESGFNDAIAEIRKVNPNAATWIEGVDKSHWATAFFQGQRFGHLTSNIAESLNAWVLEARNMPIFAMMELIHDELAGWFYTRRVEGDTAWERAGEMAPRTLVSTSEKEVCETLVFSRRYSSIRSSETVFKIIGGNEPRVVDLEARTCTCHMWRRIGLPCAHAVTAILQKEDRVQDYAHPGYTLASYLNTYRGVVYPVVLGFSDDEVNEDVTLPPEARRQPGRPKKRRIRTEDRGSQKRALRCKNCQEVGHNRRSGRAPPA